MKHVWLYVLAIAVALFAPAAIRASSVETIGDPRQISIVTTDIPHFWAAFDSAGSNAEKAYAEKYFAPGSRGLWAFVPDRLVSPWHLAAIVAKRRAYYQAIRPYTLQIRGEAGAIRADLMRFKRMYPAAVFENVYFVIGALNSGGTSDDTVGAIIGTEMIAKPPHYVDSMAGVPGELLHTANEAPILVTHEFMHFNQRDADTQAMLDAALVEGTAQFVSEMVDGHVSDSRQWSAGCAGEDALWTAFSRDMSSRDVKTVNRWLFDFSGSPGNLPQFMGYWVGARIAQTYYDNAPDKAQALHDIFNISDYKEFLARSGYPVRKPACVPEKAVL